MSKKLLKTMTQYNCPIPINVVEYKKDKENKERIEPPALNMSRRLSDAVSSPAKTGDPRMVRGVTAKSRVAKLLPAAFGDCHAPSSIYIFLCSTISILLSVIAKT